MKPQLSRHRILSLCVIALCVFSGAWFGIHAEPQQDKVTQKLIGAWRLVSVEGTDPTFHFAYDQPTGRIIYDRSGWMAVQIDIKGDHKPFVNGIGSGTLEEKAVAFDNYVSYYGTYTLDLKAQTITHHLEDLPTRVGAAEIMSDGLNFKATTNFSLSPAKTAMEA
jgi:hypothetical protein